MEEVLIAAQSFTSVGGGGGDRLWVVLLEEVCRFVPDSVSVLIQAKTVTNLLGINIMRFI